MKIRYCGDRVVDVGDHLDVHPGDVIEVPDEQGETLLLAGATHHDVLDEDGVAIVDEETGVRLINVVLPDDPMWLPADAPVPAATKKAATKKAAAVDGRTTTTTDDPAAVPADNEEG